MPVCCAVENVFLQLLMTSNFTTIVDGFTAESSLAILARSFLKQRVGPVAYRHPSKSFPPS